MIDTLASIVGWTLLHSLWQGAAIALVAVTLLAVVPRSAVRTRYGILCGALFAHLGAPIVTASLIAPRAWHNTAGAVERLTVADITSVSSPGTIAVSSGGNMVIRIGPQARELAVSRVRDAIARAGLERFLPIVVLAWSLGVAVGAVRCVGGWLLLRRLVNRATPATEEIAARVRSLARAMGIHRTIGVLVSNDVTGPFTTGWIRPVIVLPLSMLSGLDPVHVNAILTHELAHIRRWDYFVAIAQAVATTVLFHHPVTWWLDRRLRVEREYCCDDLAVAASQDRVGYVRALAELESLRLGLPSLALAATDGSLHDRVARLLAGRSASAPAGWAPAATVLAVLFAASVVEAAGVPSGAAGAADVADVRVADVAIAVRDEKRIVNTAVQRISVIPHPDPSAPFEARWRWALDQARARPAGDDVLIGWRVRGAVYDGGLVISSTDGSSDLDNRGGGVRVGDLVRASGGDAGGVAIALTWSGGPDGRLTAVRLRSLQSTISLGDRSLLWLHLADDASSIARLEQLLATTDPRLRSELAAALSLHDDPALVVRAVTRVVETDPEPQVRGEAVSWLGSHADDARVMSLLRRAADDPDARVRDEAVSTLGGKPGARATLLALIASSSHADVRREAVQRLAGGGDDAIPTLVGIAFDDTDEGVQAEAVDAIKETSGSAATRALRDIAQRHSNRRLRSEARDALDGRGIR